MLFMEHKYLLDCSQWVITGLCSDVDQSTGLCSDVDQSTGLCSDVDQSTPFPDTEFHKDLF